MTDELDDFDATVRGCKALLVGILLRAVHDWVLYRGSSRLQRKRIAEDAYRWIFLENGDSLANIERKRSQKELTSFLTICEVLELDTEVVRRQIKELREEDVITSGRPATRRRVTHNVEDTYEVISYRLHLPVRGGE